MRRAYRELQGLFAVYKPPGVHWKRVRDTIETRLIQDLRSLDRPPQPEQVRFLLGSGEGQDPSELTLTATNVPVLAEHPLVKGPPFPHLKVGVGAHLDLPSSGVLILGVGSGNQLLQRLKSQHLSKEYIVQGVFGKATDDFSDTGRLVEKTTFDHVTLCSLEKIIAMIDGTHRKALLTYAGIDLHSQEAYEQAVAGLLRPSHKTTPLITGIRCVHFDPPHFTLEVQSLNETQQYLRKVVHEIGLELRSSAVCGQVRRTRDGPFTQHDALLHSHWDLDKVRAAVAEAGPRVWAALRCARDVQPGERRESVRATNTESAEHT
ncbi:mitochondrial mRNA pseudouridine synthase TRUB2 [Polypterus senegalus]|uniref:mitochondrial mRNA pseudouridine synthase TRUB2 n=1 Tax=Polypterus senegalus TaxID=55291 RepID=UPI00196568A6|nr:mitochondrial mRNA pseudouridine synthase TRUB2 [Polypterus senegalus]